MRWKYRALPVLLTLVLTAAACSGGGASPTETTSPTAPSPTPGTTPSPIATVTPMPYEPPHTQPGPAADRLFFKAFNVDRAPLDFKSGAMDLYLFSLKTAAARQLRSDPEARLIEAPATSTSIILNPAPAPEGQLNPFSIKEVRQAVQYLVNRNFIASDIYQGLALPMLTHLSPTDFDFLTVYDQVKSSVIGYDPGFARATIQQEMAKAGAQLVDGRWQYQGSPVRLKFIIRVEDERLDIGDLVRAELEKAGFSVASSYQQFAPAVLTVYSSDPKAFEWHLYTEGWGRSAPQRYDFATINQMAAPWQGNMPGWREVGFWQYENARLDELGKRLFTGGFQSAEERDQIYREITEIALDESIRIWVATVQNSFLVGTQVGGVTSDQVAGPRGPWTLREASTPGEDEDALTTLTAGHLWVWTERTTWNPVGGFGDVYSNDIWQHLHDPPLWNHPFTGVPSPFRATFSVDSAGPAGKLSVPQDAIQWDPQGDRWQPVGAGVRATSKVTFDYSKYFSSKWHDGQPIAMADVIYSIAQGYELAYDEDKAQIEFALGVTTRPYLDTFRGYRILENNRLEVYVDFWHFEGSQIASYASPSGLSTPWELLAAMDDLVFEQRRAAYSDTAAARFNVPWISLVMDRDARLVANTLRDFASEDFVPQGVFTIGNQSLVSPEEAQARYQAARDWFGEHGLLVISNGPFMLTRYDPPAQFAELEAFRDASYPFHPGDWFFGSPPRLEIKRVEESQVSIGQPAQFSVEVEGPGTLGLRYVLLDPAAGEVITLGEATLSGGKFVVPIGSEITSALEPGLYQLFLAAYSDEIATLTERKVDLDVGP